MSAERRDYSSYIAGLRERARQEAEARKERASRARSLLPAIVSLLSTEFGARRVVLFGSLVRGGFHEHSDIDLIVNGIEPSRWFEADARVADLAFPFEVELVPEVNARPAVLANARRDGEVLLDAV